VIRFLPAWPWTLQSGGKNVSMAAFIATLSGDFHNQRPFSSDDAEQPETYAASAKTGFGKTVRLKRT
jgi:hypothetical protein